MDKIRGYVNEHVVPPLRASIVPVDQMKEARGSMVAAQYLDAVKDLGGLLQAAPDIFMATAAGQRTGSHHFDREADRAIARIEPYLQGRFPAQLQELERVKQALTLDEVGASLV